MFGFPTRVRYLFHRAPSREGGWPPERGVVDREIEIAISQFAPGSQTVKDDKLHTAVGVVDYYPFGGSVAQAPDPLAQARTVGVCRRCQALVEQPAASGGCPYCSAARGPQGYRVAEISEPPGFSTWFGISEKAEFTGGFEFTPRALRARMGGATGVPQAQRNFNVESKSGLVYRINDNDGQDFTFRKVSGQNVWITQEAFDQALLDLPERERRAIRAPAFDNASLTRALAAISSTDVLTAGLNAVPVGLTLNPAIPEARAAWYSFGFLLRRAAAVRLDVSEDELDLGLQPVMDFSNPFSPPSASVFISDSLENGAGYSARLSGPVEFEELLLFMLGSLTGPSAAQSAAFYNPFVAPTHEAECATSCHRCLREYGNMAFHPLLDWRLGLDMARLALDDSVPIDLSQGYWASLTARVAAPFFAGLDLAQTLLGGLPAGVNGFKNEAVFLTHPLWDQDASNLRPELAAAFAAAERQGLKPVPYSIFRAVRFPYEYGVD
jgi:hypothetical protein